MTKTWFGRAGCGVGTGDGVGVAVGDGVGEGLFGIGVGEGVGEETGTGLGEGLGAVVSDEIPLHPANRSELMRRNKETGEKKSR